MNLTRHPLVIVAVVIALLLPCVAQAENASTGVIVGTIVTRETARPVEGAVVIVNNSALQGTSTVLGRFKVDKVQEGRATVVVRAAGFLEVRFNKVEIRAGEETVLQIELNQTPNFLEHVQVTSMKMPSTIGAVPALVDIIDRQEFKARGDQELTQAIAHVPGALISTQAGSFESVSFRGMPRDGNEFTNTLLLIDGVPQTDSRNSARVVNLSIAEASHIEVVRGPNSALYGRTAIGGSINILTALPTLHHEFDVDFTAGQFGTLKGAVQASGPVGQWGGYFVSMGNERNGGYFTSPFGFGIDETNIFAKLTFASSARSTGSVSVNRVLANHSTPTNVPIVDGRLLSDLDPRVDRFMNFNLPGPNYHQSEGRVTLNYRHHINTSMRLVETFGYRRVRYQFIDDGDVIGGPFDLAGGTFTMYPFEMQTDEDNFYQDLRLETATMAGGMAQSIMAGVTYERNNGFSAGNLIFTDSNLLGWTMSYLEPKIPSKNEWRYFRFGGKDYTVGIAGGYAQYTIEPSSRWQLIAGGRYDRFVLKNTLTFISSQPQLKDTFDAFSPKLGVTYRLFQTDQNNTTVNIYGAYSQAFLPPRRPTDLQPSNVQLKLSPEDIENYEIGLKGSLFGGRVSVETAAFKMTREGIVTTVRQGPFFLPTNAGAHVYRGIELSARWAALRQASIYFNASFYRNRFGTFIIQSGSGDTVLTGKRLPIAPDSIWNLGAAFTIFSAVDFRVDMKYVSDVQLDQRNTFKFDSYTLMDTAVSWRRGPMRLTLSAHNIFNANYFWNGDIASGESADPGRPRQVLVTTSWSFQ